MPRIARSYPAQAIILPGRQRFGEPPAPPVLDCLLNEMLADSPSMLLRMNEPSGNPQDSSAGGANDGTIVGGVTMGSAALVSTDTSADFNGSTGYVTVADGAWIDRGDAAFTIAVVIKQDTVGAWHIPFTKGLSAPALTINPSSIIRLQTGDGGTNTVAATNVLTDTTSRHMIVATYDGTDGSIFVDGVDDTDVGSRLATTFVDNNQLVTIGADDGGTNYVDGRMAYVAYFPSAISAGRIATWWASIDVACPAVGTEDPYPYIGAGYYG